jgi:hypothetical protein
MNSFFSDIGDSIHKYFLNIEDTIEKAYNGDAKSTIKTTEKSLEDSVKKPTSDNITIYKSKAELPPKCDNTIDEGKYGLLSILYKNYPKTMLMILILHILISVCAMVLSWECNRMTNPILRLIVTVVATIFSEFYIIYYAIYHIIMGFQCYVTVPPSTLSAASKSVSLPPL